MRNTAKALGIIAACLIFIGVGLKMVHFPGGSIIVILGTGIFAGVFLPIISAYKLKNATTGIERAAAVLGWMGGGALSIGLLFTIQHWPGAMQFLVVGGGASVIFLGLHFVSLSNYPADRKKFGIFDVLVIVVFGMLLLGRNSAIGSTMETKKQVAKYDSLHSVWYNDQQSNYQLSDFLITSLKDSISIDAAKKIHGESIEITQYINELRGELVGYAEGMNSRQGDTLSVKYMRRLRDFDTPTHFMIGSDPANVTGKSKEVKAKLVMYYRELKNLLPEGAQNDFAAQTKQFIPGDVKEDDRTVSWEWHYFYHKTMIECLVNFTELQNNILAAEKSALEQIQKNSPK